MNKIFNARNVALAAVSLWVSGAVAPNWAFAADIQSISGGQRGGYDVVQIDFTEPVQGDPVTFSVQSPARVSLDFIEAGVVSGRKQVEVNQGNLRAINAVAAGDRARVVLNLREPTTYRVEKEGKSVFVYLNPTAQTMSKPAAAVIPRSLAVAPIAVSSANAVGGLDFRRGIDGAGRVIVDLPNPSTNVDLKLEGRRVVLEMPNTSLPAQLRKRLDVTDFGTPISEVVAQQTGNATRIEIEANGDWVHSAYQSDGQYVVEVRAVAPDPKKLTQGTGFTGERLSLNFQNIEIRSLLQVIADFTKFNIVTSDTVQGSLTLRLEDVPWDQALQIILDSKGLGFEKNGNVLWVAPQTEIDARKQQNYEAAQALARLEPLRTQSYQLNYARAENLADQLTGNSSSSSGLGGGTDANNDNRFLSPRGSAIAEKRTNQLFITDTPSKLEEVTRLIASWDIPVRQVLIEARIVEASDTFGRSLGVRLGAVDRRAQNAGHSNVRARFGNDYGALSSTGTGNNTSSSFLNFPATLSGGQQAATFALSIFNSAADRFLNLELSALESTGDGRIVSSPRVITADQVKATIEQGTEFPYAVTAPNGATTVEFKAAVMKLEVTPQITPEGNVILDLIVNKDSPNLSQQLNGAVAIDTKRVTTQVLVENGGTVVIGGIFELQESNNVTKVPFLGDLPIAGALFRSRSRETSKNELLVFITPKIVNESNSLR